MDLETYRKNRKLRRFLQKIFQPILNKLETTLQLGVETDFSRQKWPPSHLDEIDRDLLASQVAQGSVTFCILFFFPFEDLLNVKFVNLQ